MKYTPAEEREVAPAPSSVPSPSPAVVMEAIVKQLALAATYNRAEVTLAPHILYTKHGELHVDALTLDRDGRPPKEPKIGTFKLTGLGAVRVTARRFEPSELFHPKDPRYADVTLIAVDRR